MLRFKMNYIYCVFLFVLARDTSALQPVIENNNTTLIVVKTNVDSEVKRAADQNPVVDKIEKTNGTAKNDSTKQLPVNTGGSVPLPNITSNKEEVELDRELITTTTSGKWNLDHSVSMNSGAALRGFYLLLGLSVVVVLYFGAKALRLRSSRTVHKYGVLRQDVQEMTPLPLAHHDDSDEDDHTVFEQRAVVHA